MSFQRHHAAGRRFWTSRGVALVAIVAVHGLAAAVGLLARSAPPEAPQAEPILVTMIDEIRPESAPLPRPRLDDVRLPETVVPVVSIDLYQEPAPAAITVAVSQSAPDALAGDTDAPIMATTVEYIRPLRTVYPAEAKRARATGTVHVLALVETDGHVRDARVHRSSGHAQLDRAACDSVRAAVFKPYMLDGVPRSARVIVPIDFSLTMRTAHR